MAPWNNAARTAAAQQAEALKDHSRHPNPWNNAARTAAAQQGEALKDHCRHPDPWNNAARTAAAQQGEALKDHSRHPDPWNNAARTAVGQHGGPPEDYNLYHPNHRTDLLKHKEEMDTPILNTNCWCMYTLQVMQAVEKRKEKTPPS